VHADITECGALLQGASVVVMNNVFEFFHDAAQQAAIWRALIPLLRRKGLRLVTVPALAISLARARVDDIDLHTWLRELPLRQPYPTQPSLEDASVRESAFHSEALAEQNEIFEQIHIYEVIG
jgi:hypothetical protein